MQIASWIAAAVALRLGLLMLLPSPLLSYIQDPQRYELVTPLTSHRRLLEGLHLMEQGASPYSGDLVHHAPLVLSLVQSVSKQLKVGPVAQVSAAITATATSMAPETQHVRWAVILLTLVSDVLAGLALAGVARYSVRWLDGSRLKNNQNKPEASAATSSLFAVTEKDADDAAQTTLLVWLFNPFSILCFLAHSTASWDAFLIASALYFAVKQHSALAALFCVLAGYSSLYPIALVAPLALAIASHPPVLQLHSAPSSALAAVNSVQAPSDVSTWRVVVFGFWVVAWTLVVALASYLYIDSWDFVDAVFGFIIQVPDLTPNIGLMWYFFTEIFMHFRPFFAWVFQLHVFIYVFPLSVQFRRHPPLLAFAIVTIITVFKSYPSMGDLALVFSMLCMFPQLNPCTLNDVVVCWHFPPSVFGWTASTNCSWLVQTCGSDSLLAAF
ncbi:phosphatidylinositol glycan anchor biosynthesis class U protein, variant 1 [Capsaspora owczarzaki ATCC 30864]|uniref:Phosphatidylinositol glycan anchor biosynthesis class U protein, variant 1 n=1 Tax=Capsaspora owczarzaki (strain ATCC 30864) TaxID=595528 RepID=A0A0D2X1C3_CAPO3|nr:phosphatidylinositol glycan anchor biosynthesis class U protein, variant 1 [Capsaspora owczarzaki ATCC 30864]